MQILPRFVLAVSVALSAGCKKDETTSSPAAAAASPTTATVASPTAPKTKAPSPHGATGATPGTSGKGGKVLETMESGGYTYARLDAKGKEMWVAGPTTPLTVGQHLEVGAGSLMRDFHSKSLNRTFPEIYFVSSLGAPSTAGKDPHAGITAAGGKNVKVGIIAPAPGGKRIAEIFATKDALKGKPVVVRGKVVKFNAGIMGRNWIHLQDGSGSKDTRDLTVTTAATVAVGDIITVSGTLATERKFGADYNYPVIVENAVVKTK